MVLIVKCHFLRKMLARMERPYRCFQRPDVKSFLQFGKMIGKSKFDKLTGLALIFMLSSRSFQALFGKTFVFRNLFISSARISLKSSTTTARWIGVCNWHTSRNERSATVFSALVMLKLSSWTVSRFQVIMKVRSKADLRSALMRTLILGVLFGLTFLQIEKTQSDTWHPKNLIPEKIYWQFGITFWTPSAQPRPFSPSMVASSSQWWWESWTSQLVQQKTPHASNLGFFSLNFVPYFRIHFPKFLKSHGHPLGPVHVGSNGHPDANANVDSWTSQWSLWSVKLNFRYC